MIDKKLIARLEEIAKDKGKSANQIMQEALDWWEIQEKLFEEALERAGIMIKNTKQEVK